MAALEKSIYSHSPKLRHRWFLDRWRISRDSIFQEFRVRIKLVVSEYLFCEEKKYIFILMKNLENARNLRANDNLRWRNLFVNWRLFILITISDVQQYRWRCKSTWRVKRRNQALKSGEIRTCSSHSQQASILIIPCLVFIAARSNQRPRTHWHKLQ